MNTDAEANRYPKPLPQTGELRQIFEFQIERFAYTGDEEAYRQATWANRLLTKIHRDREDQKSQESKNG